MDCYATYDGINERRMQTVYLYHVKNETIQRISEITNYAVGTVKNYVKKFIGLLDAAKEYFTDVVNKVKKRRASKYDALITWDEKAPILPNKTEQFYLLKLLDKDGKIVFSKVGTTTRETTQRMREHLKYYAKCGVKSIYVDRVWDCGDIPAESFESLFRAYYIRKYPGKFYKNDRFTAVKFNPEEADEIVEKWMAWDGTNFA